MRQIPRPGQCYRDKEQRFYQILAVAAHGETGEELAVCQAMFGEFRAYACPLSWFSEEGEEARFTLAGSLAGLLGQEEKAGEELPFGVGGSQSQTSAPKEPHPLLLRFLEAEEDEARLGVLNQMRGKISQRELDSLYVVLDMAPMEGTADSQLGKIIRALETRRKYDGRRLR